MLIDENTQDVDLENNEADGATDESKDEKDDTKGKILVDRAEYFRLKNQKEGENKEEIVSNPTDPVTKADLYKMNERQAIRLATTPTATDSETDAGLKQEINDHYEEITKYYVPRSGKETVEDIVEDLKDAHAAWLRRGGRKDDANKGSSSKLTRDTGTRGTSPSSDTKGSSIPPRQKSGLANWY
jgi:hypothetical protein